MYVWITMNVYVFVCMYVFIVCLSICMSVCMMYIYRNNKKGPCHEQICV